MLSKKFIKPTILAAAMVLAFGTGYLNQYSGITPAKASTIQETTTPVSLRSQLPDFSKLVEENGKAVVSIATVKKARKNRIQNFGGLPDEQLEMLRRFGFPFPFGGDIPGAPQNAPEKRGMGSGFIISADGLILTNHHVVDGADELTIRLPDKREFKGKVLGSDQKTDVAVIKIEGKNLPTVRLGDTSKLKVGEWVAAIGAPFGLDNTVTAGIVSAKSRNLPDDQFVPFIQTDVAVNPGNSGGPLFNMDGEVVGINSQIFSTSGGFMGLSFAIPIDLAVQIKDQLVKTGKVSRGRVGVMIQSMTPELASSFGLSKPHGALIAQVEKKGPAEKACLKEGDIITEFNGKTIEEASDLSRAVANTAPGTKASLKVWRDGAEKSMSIKVDEMKSGKNTSINSNSSDTDEARLGVSVRPTNDQEKSRGMSEGLVIQSVEGAAAEAGLLSGDVIISVNGKRVKSVDDLQSIVSKAKDSVAILVERRGNRIFVPVKLKSAK